MPAARTGEKAAAGACTGSPPPGAREKARLPPRTCLPPRTAWTPFRADREGPAEAAGEQDPHEAPHQPVAAAARHSLVQSTARQR